MADLPEFGIPTTFPIGDKRDLLLDSDQIEQALENCLRWGKSLEVRSSA